jgi:hypothetical protein
MHTLAKKFKLLFILLSGHTQANDFPNTHIKDKKNNSTQHVPKEWKELLDPSYDKFHYEGNHKPDAGYLIFAKNPTSENARFWLLRQEAKAERLTKMNSLVEEENKKLIKEGLIKDRYSVIKNGQSAALSTKTEVLSLKEQHQFRDMEVYMIGSSSCKFCKRQLALLKSINGLKIFHIKGSQPLKGSKEFSWKWIRIELKELFEGILSAGFLPVTILYFPKKNTATSLEGFTTKKELFESVRKLKE